MRYEGYIKGYEVSYENEYSLWDKQYRSATAYGVKKCLMLLPPTISQEDFLAGMMRLTRGTVSPAIIIDVWKEVRNEYLV